MDSTNRRARLHDKPGVNFVEVQQVVSTSGSKSKLDGDLASRWRPGTRHTGLG